MPASQDLGGSVLHFDGQWPLQGIQADCLGGTRRFHARGGEPLVVAVADLALVGQDHQAQAAYMSMSDIARAALRLCRPSPETFSTSLTQLSLPTTTLIFSPLTSKK